MMNSSPSSRVAFRPESGIPRGTALPDEASRAIRSYFCLDFIGCLGYLSHLLSGNNSAVECNLAKVEVAGSNPVSRSIDKNSQGGVIPPFFCLFFRTPHESFK